MKNHIDIIKNIGRDKLIIIIIAGIVLVLCTIWESDADISGNGSSSTKEKTENTAYEEMEKYIHTQENKLKELLKKIDGTGDIYVMITLKKTEEKNILTEKDIAYEDTSESDADGGNRNVYTYSEENRTVLVSDDNGSGSPYVISNEVPLVEGVAVVCDNEVDSKTKEKIISVIKALFNIDINKISVTG